MPIISNSVTKALLNELTTAFNMVLINSGIKENSDLIKSVGIEYTTNLFTVYANDYMIWVSTGRRPGVKKVPINALILFIKKNNITIGKLGINQVAFAIQNAIYKNGIMAKNFMEKLIATSLEVISESMVENIVAEIEVVVFNTFDKKYVINA